MFDALSFPQAPAADAAVPSSLGMPLIIGTADRWRFLGYGRALHLNRMRPCAWHLVVHRSGPDTPWTHLYKVVSDHAGHILVLLHEAVEGDCGERPERFSRWPLPRGVQDCEAG